MEKNARDKIKLSAITALFAAMYTVTIYFVRFPFAFMNYEILHIGDALLILSAALLPKHNAMFVGSVGGGMANLLMGATMWMPWTIIIKALLAACFSNKGERIVTKRNCVFLISAVVVNVVGYNIVAGTIIQGDIRVAMLTSWVNVIQGVLSAIAFVILGLALDRLEFKKKLLR